MATLAAAVTLTGCTATSVPPIPSTSSAAETADPADATSSPPVPPPVKTEESHLWEFAPPDDPEAVAGWN